MKIEEHTEPNETRTGDRALRTRRKTAGDPGVKGGFSPDSTNKVVALKLLCTFKSGGTPSKNKVAFWGGKYPWVTAKDLKRSILNDSIDQLTEEGFRNAKTAPKDSLFVLVRGMTLFKDVPVCLTGREMAFNQDIKALLPISGVDPNYLLFFLASKKHELLRYVDSAGHGTGRMNIDLLGRLTIMLPPLAEQKAIADLLSIWDEAIDKTEQLIRAKEAQFQWLLNGLAWQGRNNSSWKRYSLKEICSPVSRKNSENNVNVLTSSARDGLVSQHEYYNKAISADDVTGYYLLSRGEFAYNRSSAKGYPFGATKRLDKYEKGVLSTLYLCFSLNPDAPCESDFLSYVFESGAINRELRAICQEGARSHGLLNITKSEFFGIKISLPPQESQKKIQSTLNLAQQEIKRMRGLAEQYKSQKRGLMQKLLTGEWRVRTEA